MSIDATLAERGQRYGEFDEHARITQNIKNAMDDSPNWGILDADMAEALEMVAHKVGRILNGDPNYIDSWHDIIGYVRLVEQRLEKEQAPKSDLPKPDKADRKFSDALLAALKEKYGDNVEVHFLGEDSGEI